MKYPTHTGPPLTTLFFIQHNFVSTERLLCASFLGTEAKEATIPITEELILSWRAGDGQRKRARSGENCPARKGLRHPCRRGHAGFRVKEVPCLKEPDGPRGLGGLGHWSCSDLLPSVPETVILEISALVTSLTPALLEWLGIGGHRRQRRRPSPPGQTLRLGFTLLYTKLSRRHLKTHQGKAKKRLCRIVVQGKSLESVCLGWSLLLIHWVTLSTLFDLWEAHFLILR